MDLYIGVVLLVVTLILLNIDWHGRLPPGPRKWPIIGNLLSFPTTKAGQVFQQLGMQFGTDIIHFDAAGQPVVVLNSFEGAIEVLEKHSAISSSRPVLVMSGELMGLADWDTGSMPYGDAWRSRRALLHKALHKDAARVFMPNLQRTARGLLYRLLTSAEDATKHMELAAARNVMYMVYGIELASLEDPWLKMISRVNRLLVDAATPGAYLVDFLPVLKHVPKWFPGATFRRNADIWKAVMEESIIQPFEATKKMMSEGFAQPSFVSLQLETLRGDEDVQEQETMIAQVAKTMFGAGSDTTAAVLKSFLLAMMLYPDVAKLAQSELDRVLPPGQLPTLDDQDKLPYVTAIVDEVLRWAPTAPLGVPHKTIEEHVYHGFRIPNESIVISNIWGMLNDPLVYPEPEKFKPDRFLTDGKLNPDIRDPKLIAFGFGRRACPGRHLALSAVWITVASILTVYDIQPQDGDAPVPAFEESSIVRAPLPFKCLITPRSPSALQTINACRAEDSLQ